MGLFGKKEISQVKREAKLEQELEDYNKFKAKLDTVCDEHTEHIKKLKARHINEIERLHDDFKDREKERKDKRLMEYRELIKDKDLTIESLSKELTKITAQLRKYREAFDMFRPYRDHLIDFSKKMSGTTQRIRMTAAELDQSFQILEEMALFQERASKSDTKVLTKMSPELIDPEVTLRLIENDSYSEEYH